MGRGGVGAVLAWCGARGGAWLRAQSRQNRVRLVLGSAVDQATIALSLRDISQPALGRRGTSVLRQEEHVSYYNYCNYNES